MIVRWRVFLCIDEPERRMILIRTRCPPKLGIDPSCGQKLRMSASFDNASVFKHEDEISIHHGSESMRNDECRSIDRKPPQSEHQAVLSRRIQTTTGFIENDYRCRA